MRSNKIIYLSILLSFLLCQISLGGVDTREISRVRDKGILNSGDFRVIDDFVSEAVSELVKTRDFTTVSRIRALIIANGKSNVDSAEGQYSSRFYSSLHKSLSEAFDRIPTLDPVDRQVKVAVNLLILIDSLGDVRLADLAIDKLGDEDKTVRYWATHCLVNDRIIAQLNANTDNLKTGRKIAQELEKIVGKCEPDMIRLIVNFAAKLAIADGDQLLLKIADERIQKHLDWDFEQPLLDDVILKGLYSKIAKGGSKKAEFLGRFSQIYSLIIERYISELKEGGSISERDQIYLGSVIIGAEDKYLGKMLGIRQTVLKRAVEQGDHMSLSSEHKRLFGESPSPGLLSQKLVFDYGRVADGKVRKNPIPLGERPAKFKTE